MSPTKNPYTKTVDATNLRESSQLKRLRAHLHDLIIVALEAYTQTPGKSYSLVRLSYVSDEKHEGKFCMHLDGLVKDLEANANIPMSLTLSVKIGDNECYQQL